jgi:2-oxoglutarate dehydrogenase complex dehydrogenase (E1) component-like enzyme
MNDLPLADLVLCYLPRGRDKAITIGRLAQLVRAPHREVEQALQDLADSGLHPLCASTQRPMGVWLGTRADVHDYLERHDSRIRSMLRRRHGLRRWLVTSEPPPIPVQVQEELWAVAS